MIKFNNSKIFKLQKQVKNKNKSQKSFLFNLIIVLLKKKGIQRKFAKQ
jgi:hypothetical protein